MNDAEKLARIFKVLSVPTRVKIIDLLRDRALCVNALARHLGVSAAAVSQHLRILRHADLVTSVRYGQFVHYRVNASTFAEWNELAMGLLGPDKTG